MAFDAGSGLVWHQAFVRQGDYVLWLVFSSNRAAPELLMSDYLNQAIGKFQAWAGTR